MSQEIEYITDKDCMFEYAELDKTEVFLQSVCYEYGFDYKSDLNVTEESSTEIITEGIIGTVVDFIKGLFKKVIEILVKIWKTIVDFVKKVFEKASEFLKKHFKGKEKNTDNAQVNAKAAFFESFNVNEKHYTKFGDVKAAFKKSMDKINAEIRKRSTENISFMKRYEQKSSQAVKESVLTYVEEKVAELGQEVRDMISDKDLAEIKKKFSIISQPFVRKSSIINNPDSDGAVHFDKDAGSTIASQDIRFLDKESLRLVKEATDINEAYNNFITGKLDFIVEQADRLGDIKDNTFKNDNLNWVTYVGGQEIHHISSAIKYLRSNDFSDSEIGKFVGNMLFPELRKDMDPEQKQTMIRRWCQLKINWNQSIINILKKAIHNNYKQLELTAEQVNWTIEDLDDEDTENVKIILDRNMHKFKKFNGQVYDFRSVGLGVLVVSMDMASDTNLRHRGILANLLKGELTDRLIVQIAKYDLYLISHGGVYEGEWLMEPTLTPGGQGHFDKVEDWLDAAIGEGFRRINIANCNPGHVKLAQRFHDNKRVLIITHKDSVRVG